jgi:hypothetical protein
MIPLIEENRQAIERLCARHRVQRLELFGSATSEGFDSDSSDLDFLVEYLPLKSGQHAESYFGLLEALEALFQRPVDLVMTRAIKNPYFLEAVNRTRTVLYAA